MHFLKTVLGNTVWKKLLSKKNSLSSLSNKSFKVVEEYHSFLFCDSQRICSYDLEKMNNSIDDLDEDDFFVVLNK